MANGGSLIGRADATIVNAAYRAALGNVPVDNSAALETMRDTYKSMLDKSGEIFKQIETDKIAMDQDIQSMISPLLDELEDGTLTDPAFEDTKAQIQAFSTEAENILKSREYRRGDKSAMLDFNRRFNTYVNGIQTEKQQLEALATNLEGQAYNVTATKGQELQKGILKFYRGDKDSGVTRTFKGNKAYYTMNIGGQQVTKSLEDIADGIIPKDVKTRGKFDTDLQVVGRLAAQGKKFDAISAKKTAETLLEASPDKIKTLQDFFHTEHRGQTGTLAQGLSTGQGGFGKISAQLFTVLNKNGLLQEYDTEKTPGKITKEDFEGKNAAKYMQLVDDITSGKNYDLSKKIASELYADVVAKDEHNRLKFVPKPGGDDEDSDGVKFSGWGIQYPSTGGIGQGPKKVAYTTLQSRRNDLLNFEEQVSGEYFEYRWDGKNWFAYDGGEKVESIEGLGLDVKDGISMKDIAKIEGLKKFNEGYALFDKNVAKRKKKQQKGEGQVSIADLQETKDVSSTIKSITDGLPVEFKDKYMIVAEQPRRERGGFLGLSTVEVESDKRMIVDKETGETVATFNIGPSAMEKDAKIINDLIREEFLGDLIPGEEQ